MFILDMVSTCGNPALSNLFSIAQKMITIIQILAPILEASLPFITKNNTIPSCL